MYLSVRIVRLSCLLKVVIILSLAHAPVLGHMIGHNPHYRAQTLDPQGRYQLEWLVDFDEKRITFNVTVQTKGYVGFGLSRNGTIGEKADIVIGGVTPSGKSYFSDRYSVGNQMPELDASQDWKLLDAWESASQTFLSFSRDWDTCDEDDYAISSNRVALIWSFGEMDSEIGHHQHRGSVDTYLLDPEFTPKIIRDSVQATPKVIGKDSSDIKLWSISKTAQLAPNTKTYSCSIHKGPRLSEKNIVVGFDIHFNFSDDPKRYLHRVHLYRCHAPRGSEAQSMFDSFASNESHVQECLVLRRPQGSMPTDYCTELLHEFGPGGWTYFAPSDVGYPIGLSLDEYYMVQAHHENPDKSNTIRMEYDLELHYTNKIRANDAGVMVIGHEVPGLPPSLMIPVNSTSHMIFGHCGSECTKLMIPTEGIRIFAVGLHSHRSGRELRLQHFRNTRELSWISSDVNYNSLYKPLRNLREHVKLLPGDHLIMRCIYDNSWTSGTTVGGFFSQHEQCLAYVHYYNKINDFSSCKSEIISDDYRQRFLGITNVTWNETRHEFVVDPTSNLFESAYLGEMPVSTVSDNHVVWEPEVRAELQRFHRYHPQINTCSRELYARDVNNNDHNSTNVEEVPETQVRRVVRSGATRDVYSGATAYPFSAKEYQPEKSCSVQAKLPLT